MSEDNTGAKDGPDAEAPDDATPADQTGDSDGDADRTTGAEDFNKQEFRDSVYAEARRTFKGKIDEKDEELKKLRNELDEVKASSPNAKDDDEDVFTAEQVEERVQKVKKERDELKTRLESVNEATAKNRLVEELRERGVVKAEMFADILSDRVEADITAEDGEMFVVYTEKGTKMIDPDADGTEPASVGNLVDRWVQENPEFVLDNTQGGSNYDGPPRPSGPDTIDDAISAAEDEGDMDRSVSLKASKLQDLARQKQ